MTRRISEATIVKQIKEYCKQCGAYVVKYHGSEYSESGTPDLLICYKGVFIGCEVKVPGKSPTALQHQKLRDIEKAGGIAIWCQSLDDFKYQLPNFVKD